MTQKTKSSKHDAVLPINMVDYFFPANEKKDTPDDHPLVKASKVSQNQGISKSHLKQALAVLIVIISTRLGKWGRNMFEIRILKMLFCAH